MLFVPIGQIKRCELDFCFAKRHATDKDSVDIPDGPGMGSLTCSINPWRYVSMYPAMSKESVEMAGEPGLEPGLTESESVVLPLDDSPAGWYRSCR